MQITFGVADILLDFSSLLDDFLIIDMLAESKIGFPTILVGARLKSTLKAICDLSEDILGFLCKLFVPDVTLYGAINIYVSDRGLGILFDVEGAAGMKRHEFPGSKFFDFFYVNVLGTPPFSKSMGGLEISAEFENLVVNVCIRFKTSNGGTKFCTAQCTDDNECSATHYCGMLFGICLPKQAPGEFCLEDTACEVRFSIETAATLLIYCCYSFIRLSFFSCRVDCVHFQRLVHCVRPVRSKVLRMDVRVINSVVTI